MHTFGMVQVLLPKRCQPDHFQWAVSNVNLFPKSTLCINLQMKGGRNTDLGMNVWYCAEEQLSSSLWDGQGPTVEADTSLLCPSNSKSLTVDIYETVAHSYSQPCKHQIYIKHKTYQPLVHLQHRQSTLVSACKRQSKRSPLSFFCHSSLVSFICTGRSSQSNILSLQILFEPLSPAQHQQEFSTVLSCERSFNLMCLNKPALQSCRQQIIPSPPPDLIPSFQGVAVEGESPSRQEEGVLLIMSHVGGIDFLALSTTQHRIVCAADPNGKAQ